MNQTDRYSVFRAWPSEKMIETQRRHRDAESQEAIVLWSGRQIALQEVITRAEEIFKSDR